MTKYIGSYNIDNEGKIWNGNTRYTMVIFSRFDENEKEIERKCLYFCCTVPDFKTEKQITEFLKGKKNNQRINKVSFVYKWERKYIEQIII
jgi:hypothetical protein